LKEEIETSVRVEPGVLTLYAMADKSKPASITVFEIYATEEAYNAHRETIHFKKYKSITKDMVKSLELLNTAPIALEAKKELQMK
jgi:quinol monooxygenase YgiN